MQYTQKDVTRFWSKVDRRASDKCWNWKPGACKNGYGKFSLGSKSIGAHRFAYAVENGFPGESHVLHKCDNPLCCNPDHLFLGNILINNQDKAAKGRSYCPTGEKNPKHKLTKSDVESIREQYALGFKTQKALAIQFRTDQGHISAIVNGKRWKED